VRKGFKSPKDAQITSSAADVRISNFGPTIYSPLITNLSRRSLNKVTFIAVESAVAVESGEAWAWE